MQDLFTGIVGSVRNYQEFKDSSQWRCDDEKCWELEDEVASALPNEEPKKLVKTLSYLVPEEHLTQPIPSPVVSVNDDAQVSKKLNGQEKNKSINKHTVDLNEAKTFQPITFQQEMSSSIEIFTPNVKPTTLPRKKIINNSSSYSFGQFNVTVFAKYCLGTLAINLLSHEVLPYIVHSLEDVAKEQFLDYCSSMHFHLPFSGHSVDIDGGFF
jgi:hypothetical protein